MEVSIYLLIYPDTKVVVVVASEFFDLTPIKINDNERCDCDAFTDQKRLMVTTLLRDRTAITY